MKIEEKRLSTTEEKGGAKGKLKSEQELLVASKNYGKRKKEAGRKKKLKFKSTFNNCFFITNTFMF
jgi:hypothetical protein